VASRRADACGGNCVGDTAFEASGGAIEPAGSLQAAAGVRAAGSWQSPLEDVRSGVHDAAAETLVAVIFAACEASVEAADDTDDEEEDEDEDEGQDGEDDAAAAAERSAEMPSGGVHEGVSVRRGGSGDDERGVGTGKVHPSGDAGSIENWPWKAAVVEAAAAESNVCHESISGSHRVQDGVVLSTERRQERDEEGVATTLALLRAVGPRQHTKMRGGV
jgi:hypothetical protein